MHMQEKEQTDENNEQGDEYLEPLAKNLDTSELYDYQRIKHEKKVKFSKF